ncbi:secreted frizzled-related protein 1a [Brienomyrus brachyistius]|uniref:secreted frizzled-related protein 1a n=1 Tax=Brienomyrus brachyistius TaxID=42636 RepID=UPI0020B1BA4E|nr:secreted frizzled-related protein 1a [Brienomyrus brachyistius]
MKYFPSVQEQLSHLALVLVLVYVSNASEYEYLNWKSDIYHTGGRIYGKPPQCVDIPDDLRLCHGVGYTRMLLPNLLEHETMAEVRQQAGSWVPLVHKNCHPGTQLLLCSLFAPVCLERPIYPCRWLCEAVRDGCAPIMLAFGFPWPEMLTCDKFPLEDVCIAMSSSNATEAMKPTGDSPICPPCDNELKTDAILEHMCASEFAIKTKIKEVKKENSDRKVILQKKKRAIKLGNMKKKDLKKLVLYLKNGADCPCQQLDNPHNTYLFMGRKVDKQYLLTGIHKWDKTSKELKKAMKKMRNHKCPAFETVFK